MLALLGKMKVVAAAAVGTCALALGAHSAQASGHWSFGISLPLIVAPAPVYAAPVYTPAPVYAPAPAYSPAPVIATAPPAYSPAPVCAPAPVYVPAPVYYPAPVVVYEGGYRPFYVHRDWHHGWDRR